MEMKTMAGSIRSGRRGALASLLAGTVTLLNGPPSTEARKRCHRNTCPDRSCCVCNASSPTPGCRFASAPTASTGLSATCAKACGGAGTVGNAAYSPPSFHNSVACSPNTVECLIVDCPV
jgi:hypothetical protein